MSIIRILFCFLFLTFGFNALHAQKVSSERKMKKRTKELQNKQEQSQEEVNRDIEYLKQKHIENQNKDVQKRMKKAQKRSKRINNNRKESRFKNLFKRK